MDYNIYIHDKTGGQNKPTVPKTSGGANTTANVGNEISEDKKEAGEQGLTAAAATTTAGKVILAIYAAAKIAKGVVDTAIPFITRETGDYRFSTAYNNTWQTINNFLNPIGYVINRAGYYQENTLINKRQEQQRLLVGDSYINSVSRKV